MKVENPNELTYGMLGFFAGKVGDTSVNISGLERDGQNDNARQCVEEWEHLELVPKFLFGEEDSDSEKSRF